MASSSTRSTEQSGYGFAIGAYLFWGLVPLYWKLVDSIPAGELTALRSAQTLLVSLAFLWFVRKQSPRALLTDRKSALAHLPAGLLLGVNWLVFVYAVSTDRVVEASLGYFINPLLSVLLGLVLFGERLSRTGWLAVALASSGVAVLAVDAGELPWISLVLASSFAVYGAAKKQSKRGPIEGLAIEMIWIAPLVIGYLVWLLATGDLTGGEGATPWFLWLIGLATATPLLLFARAAQAIPLWALGLLQYIAPTLQFLLGVLVFGEAANATRLLGFAIIWFGLAVFAYNSLSLRSLAKQ